MAIPVTQVVAHWAHAYPFFSMSSSDFYSLVEQLIKEHELPNVKIERAKNKEGGLLSASREYLRVRHGDLIYDICAMPFGKDFCVSSWLYETEGMMRQFLKFTKAGEYLSERAAKRTFYQADEEAMFKSCVHNALIEATERMTEGKGMRALSDVERMLKDGGM